MTSWWEVRTRREQVLLTVLAAIAVVVVLWLGLYRPVAGARQASERRYDQAARERTVVLRAVAQMRALGPASAPLASTAASPGEAASAAAAASGISLTSVQADPEGGVQVRLGGIAPSRIFPWLAALQQQHGVRPRRLTIVKDGDGTVSVDATLIGEG